MKFRLRNTIFLMGAVLFFYSVWMIVLEANHGRQHVRQYFTDVGSPSFLYGINTSMCFVLLCGAALLFLVAAIEVDERKQVYFCYSQVFFFLYMAFDERFLIHERISWRTNTNDAWSLLLMAVFEGLCILVLGQYFKMPKVMQVAIFLGALMFGIMIIVDVFVPHSAILRQVGEDLPKLWAIASLFVYAYLYLKLNVLNRNSP